jgi:hypothetical protein
VYLWNIDGFFDGCGDGLMAVVLGGDGNYSSDDLRNILESISQSSSSLKSKSGEVDEYTIDPTIQLSILTGPLNI